MTRTPNILGADGAWLLQWTQRRAVLYRLSRRMELKSLALQKGTFSPLDDRDAVTRRPSLLAGASRVFEASECISQSNSPQTPLLTGTNLARYLDLHGAWEAAISQRKGARPCRHPPAMTPRQASLLSCCLALSRAAAGDCEPASKALRAFFDSPGPATAVFAADQVVASRGACVSQSRDGRRSTWFAAGDDGARDLRRAWCAPRRVERRNGTRGAAISRRFSAVAPYAAKTRRAAQRWRLYKRCGALNRRGRPHDHEHVDLEEAAPARVAEARRVDAIVVLLSDRLANVGHAVRDVLFLRAFAGAWACGGEQDVLYSLYLAPRNPQPPLPWVRELSEAVAASTGTRGFSPRPGEVVCVRGLVQKAAQHVGDAHTARHARAAALRRCGVEREAPATTVLYVVHGASREGSRRLGNHEAVIAALDGIAQNKGLRLDVAELGALSFCGQVRAVYRARAVVGVFGAAVGGNLIFTRDTATTVELTACGRSAPRAPDAGTLGHTFLPFAAAYAYGFVSFCLCVDDPDVDLTAKRSTRRGWFRSERLGANVGALASAVASALDGDHAGAARAAAEARPCEI